MKTLLTLLLLVTTLFAKAQNTYEKIDNYVKSLGSMDSLNVATIADKLTNPFSKPADKARAVFYWVANNIAPDLRGMRSNDARKAKPEMVIQSRTATAVGYANLVQEMLSLANIRCLTVDGFIKRSEDDIDNSVDPNHTWNVVQLGQSPSEWYYVDAAMAAGFTDKRLSTFTKNFVSEFFFTNNEVFNYQHYPDNDAWIMGDGPASLKHFYQLPVYHQHATAVGVHQPSPTNGVFKTKMRNAVTFAFRYLGKAPETIEIVTGDARKQSAPTKVTFTSDYGMIKFQHYFLKDGEYPVKILADGKPILEYSGIISE